LIFEKEHQKNTKKFINSSILTLN